MDKKLSSKFAALQNLPSAMERRVKHSEVPDRFVAVQAEPKLVAALKVLLPETGEKFTKSQKVRAWRKANPEAYAEQKRKNAEKQAAKRKAQREGKWLTQT